MAIQVGFEIDVAGFKRGIDQVKSASGQLASGIGTAIKGAAAAFAAGSAVIVAAAHGMYDAMSQGGELVDLSERTGLAIDKLMELQVAFDQAGIGAAEVGPLVNKMQNAIADAAAGSAAGQKVFADLGLSLEDLGRMDAAAQMETIGQAVSGIEDPIRRTQASMDIFGKSGGKMLALFAAGGSAEAKDALGKQAEVMAKNAAYFDSITDKLGTAAIKIRGLFIGMAAELVPDLLDAANKLKDIDFTDIGLQVGKAIAILVDLFASGRVGDAFYLAMQIATFKFVNLFVKLFLSALASIESFFIMLGGFVASVLQKPILFVFYKAGEILMQGIAKALEFLGAGIKRIPKLGAAGESLIQAGSGLKNEAAVWQATAANVKSNMSSFKDTIVQGMLDGGNAAKTIFDKIAEIDIFKGTNEEALKEIKDLLGVSSVAVEERRAKLAPAEQRKQSGDGLTVVPPAGRGQSFEAITSSMARIGGGGLTAGMSFTVSPMVDQQKTTNKLLQRIADKPTGEVVAKMQ